MNNDTETEVIQLSYISHRKLTPVQLNLKMKKVLVNDLSIFFNVFKFSYLFLVTHLKEK